MDRIRIRVLGSVTVDADGGPTVLPAQEACALAMLVAADGAEVPRSELVAALWPEPPERDLLSAVLAHLRSRLAALGLTVSRARSGRPHRLESLDPDRSVGSSVDAGVFVGLVEAGEKALDDDPVAAGRHLARAAALWSGTPYDLVTTTVPRRVRVARGRLLDRRDRLVRAWARVGLRTESHDLLDRPDLVPDDGGDDDVWLLQVVRALADDRPDDVDRLLERRRKFTGRYDDPVLERALDLLDLAQSGVEVRSGTTDPGAAPDPALQTIIDGSTGPPAPDRRVHRVSADADEVADSLRAAGRSVGLRVARASGPDPLGRLAADLWALVLRDRGLDPTPWSELRHGGTAGVGADVVGNLLDRVARRTSLVLVVDDDRTHDLADRLLERVRHRPVTVVAVSAPATAAIDRPRPLATGRAAAWAAAAAVAEHEGEIDPLLVARMLATVDGDGKDPETSRDDPALAAAVAADVVRVDDTVRFTDDPARRAALRRLWSDPARARALHAAAMGSLGDRADDVPTRRAEHAWRARPLVGENEVARMFLAAALDARGRGDDDGAVDLARRGLAADGDPASRFDLLMCQGDAHHDGARMAAAANAFAAASTLAEQSDLPGGSLGRRARAVLRSARRWSDPGRIDHVLVARLRALHVELAGAPEHRDEWLRIGGHLAHKSTMALDDPAEVVAGVAVAHEVLDALGPGTDPEAACDVLVECRWALFDHVPPTDARVLSRRLAEAALASESVHYRGESLICGVVDLLRLGEIDAARSLTESHRDHVGRHRHGLGPWLESTLDTLFDLWDGRLDAADARLDRDEHWMLADHPTRDRTDSLRQTWLGQRFWLRREQGRSAQLFAGDVGRLVAGRRFFPVWAAGAALLQADVGLLDPAIAQIEALVAQLDHFPPHGWTVPTSVLLAEALDVLGRAGVPTDRLAPSAAAVEDVLRPHADETVLAGWPTVLLGPVARALTDVGGRSTEAEALLVDVRSVATHHGAVLLAREADAVCG